MYYISKPNEIGFSKIVKRLSDFSRAMPEEGSKWLVRKRRKISSLDSLPVYVWTKGKLKKTNREVIVFWE